MKQRLDEDAKAFVVANLTDPDLDVTLALLEIGDCPTCLTRYEAAFQLLGTDPDVARLLDPGSEPPRILVESLLRIARAGYSGPHAEELAALQAIEARLARAGAAAARARAPAPAQPALQPPASAEAPRLIVLAADALRECLLDSVRELGRFALARLLPGREILEALVDRLEEDRWEVRPATYGAPEGGDTLLEATKHELVDTGEVETGTCRFEILERLALVRAGSQAECRIVGRIAARDVLTPEKDWLFALYSNVEVHGLHGVCIPIHLKRPSGASSAFEGTPDPDLRLPLRLASSEPLPLLSTDWRKTWRATVIALPERRHARRPVLRLP